MSHSGFLYLLANYGHAPGQKLTLDGLRLFRGFAFTLFRAWGFFSCAIALVGEAELEGTAGGRGSFKGPGPVGKPGAIP